jgi:hypothetical protein
MAPRAESVSLTSTTLFEDKASPLWSPNRCVPAVRAIARSQADRGRPKSFGDRRLRNRGAAETGVRGSKLQKQKLASWSRPGTTFFDFLLRESHNSVGRRYVRGQRFNFRFCAYSTISSE